jgi:hypothetical protein
VDDPGHPGRGHCCQEHPRQRREEQHLCHVLFFGGHPADPQGQARRRPAGHVLLLLTISAARPTNITVISIIAMTILAILALFSWPL